MRISRGLPVLLLFFCIPDLIVPELPKFSRQTRVFKRGDPDYMANAYQYAYSGHDGMEGWASSCSGADTFNQQEGSAYKW